MTYKYTDSTNRVVVNDSGTWSGLVTSAEVQAWISAGNTPAPADVPTQAQIIASYEASLDAHLDSVAKTHRYNDRFTFAVRAGYAGPYKAEAVAFAQWMDACNVQAFALLADVVAGNAPIPTVEAFISGLPEFSLL